MAVPCSLVLLNVKTLLNDAGLIHWTQNELLQWGSEGQVELVTLKPDAATKTVDLQLVSGARQTNPADCISILDMRQNDNGNAITPTDRATLDRFMPGWMKGPTASTVKHWMSDPQPDTFYVYPAQNTTPAKVVITHSFTPPALVAGGNLGVRDIYQAAIENYILFRAFSKDSEPASAERAMAYGKAFYG